MNPTSHRFRLAAALLLVATLATGCFNPFNPQVANVRGTTEAAPNPTTVSELLKLFAWCWNNRAYDEYTEIFTDDFQFQFALADSAGNAFRDHGLYRQEELDTARHLFVEGTAVEPPARTISLALGVVIPFPDSRTGKEYPWHQEVRTTVVLTIDTGDQQFQVTGAARFFVVRGDSARIPDEMLAKGFTRDRNRWYIERWEDETINPDGGQLVAAAGSGLSALKRTVPAGRMATVAGSPVAVAPSSSRALPLEVTWGTVKALYVNGFR